MIIVSSHRFIIIPGCADLDIHERSATTWLIKRNTPKHDQFITSSRPLSASQLIDRTPRQSTHYVPSLQHLLHSTSTTIPDCPA